jgi:hypothetical protein
MFFFVLTDNSSQGQRVKDKKKTREDMTCQQLPRYKTVPCEFGRQCTLQRHCEYAHTFEELHVLCVDASYKQNACIRGKFCPRMRECDLWHGEKEIPWCGECGLTLLLSEDGKSVLAKLHRVPGKCVSQADIKRYYSLLCVVAAKFHAKCRTFIEFHDYTYDQLECAASLHASTCSWKRNRPIQTTQNNTQNTQNTQVRMAQ